MRSDPRPNLRGCVPLNKPSPATAFKRVVRQRGQWFQVGELVRVLLVRTDQFAQRSGRRQCDVLLQVNGRDHFFGGMQVADLVAIEPKQQRQLGKTWPGYTVQRIALEERATWHRCETGNDVPGCHFSVQYAGGESVTFLVTAPPGVSIVLGEEPLPPPPDPGGGTASVRVRVKQRSFWDAGQAGVATARKAA